METCGILPTLFTVLVLTVTCNGCYTNYQTCYTTFGNVSAPSGSDDTTNYCSAAETAVNCLKTDASDCTGSDVAPNMYTTYLQNLENVKLSCVMASCGLKQQDCSNKTLGAYNLVSGGSPDASTLSKFCSDMPIALTCYENLMSECPSLANDLNTTVQQFTSLKDLYCNGASLPAAGCVDKSLQCANISLEMADVFKTVDMTNMQALTGLTATLYPFLTRTQTCFEELSSMCPSFTASVQPQMQANAALIGQVCGGGGEAGCMDKSLQCANISMEMADVFKTVDMTNMQALMGLTATLCPFLTRIQTCFGELSSMCPSLAASVQQQLQANEAMIGQVCGGGGDVNCPMKLMTCAAPALAGNCGNFSNGISTEDQIKCCGYGKTAMDCLKEANCLVTSNMPTNPLGSFERDCHGYKDYCPGLSLCLDAVKSNGGLNNINNLCTKMPSLIACVEAKCSGKPAISQIALKQIATLYGKICFGLSKSPSLMQCQAFTDCVSYAPSLPGTIANLQSTIAIRDTNHWCKIAKSYMSCAATESTKNTCSIGGTFSTDVIEVKKSVDQLCVGVRDPCINVKSCVTVLYGSQQGFTLMGTCPNIPAFVTCTNEALSKCGDSSKVKASYSLSDIGTLFSQSCESMSGLISCAAAQTCFDIRLPENLGDRIDQFSDQTFWCPKLQQIMKCTSEVSTTCSQPQQITDKLKQLFAKINKHCPEPGTATEPPTCDKDCGNGANSAGKTTEQPMCDKDCGNGATSAGKTTEQPMCDKDCGNGATSAVASLLLSIMVILLAFL